MPNCSVFSCKNRSSTSSLQKDNVTFHLFPKHAMIRDVWIRACENHVSWTPKRTSTICSLHFEASSFILQGRNKRRLKEWAIPTLNLSKINRRENSEPGTSSSKKVEVVIIEYTKPSQTEECNIVKIDPDTLQTENKNYTVPKFKCEPPLEDSESNKKLRKCLQYKNIKIRKLQSQVRFLKKRVAILQEKLYDATKKPLLVKEEPLVPDKLDTEEKEIIGDSHLTDSCIKVKLENET